MFAALTLAAREPGRWKVLAIGIAARVPFVTFGVVADFLKNVAITSGPLVASQAGFSGAQRELIAFAYQFGTLIMPTVVPAVVWVVTHRTFPHRMRGATWTPSAWWPTHRGSVARPEGRPTGAACGSGFSPTPSRSFARAPARAAPAAGPCRSSSSAAPR